MIINPLTPRQFKHIIDLLNHFNKDNNNNNNNNINDNNNNDFYYIIMAVFVYSLLKLLQGENGLMGSLEAWILIPINQHVTKSVSLDIFSHLHSLSLDFHINRKTGEILRVMDRGTNSIVSLMNYILFSILPTIMDILVALFVIMIDFDIYYSLIIFLSMILYIWATIEITEWRTKFRREMRNLDKVVGGIAVDSLLNFETVKYFNTEDYETLRYANAMKDYLLADKKDSASLPILNLIQNFILTLALLIGSLLCVYEIYKGTKTLGDFVYFNTYLLQVSNPLKSFGTLYRKVQTGLVDMEKMLELLDQSQSVKDLPNAPNLSLLNGFVEFENVSFGYSSDKLAINSLSFKVPAGKTVALVGPSGGGKSTILKLLLRFYDVNSGSIKIDGQDIRGVTQNSLRRSLGVVPQDTILFNNTIKYNIGYGVPNATDEQIQEAAKKAHIHERILNFPNGYDTIVGERGLRLSGGEKQRVSIARTILKNPKVILLDEATSALDNTIERQIQDSFKAMTDGRTTIVVAHRLSTIIDADLILCIKEGQIIESGTHQQLINIPNGIYKAMWEKRLLEE